MLFNKTKNSSKKTVLSDEELLKECERIRNTPLSLTDSECYERDARTALDACSELLQAARASDDAEHLYKFCRELSLLAMYASLDSFTASNLSKMSPTQVNYTGRERKLNAIVRDFYALFSTKNNN